MAGLDSNVKLLLHCNGADGSTSFPDASASAYTVTAVGQAQVDTAQSKFGGASALFDGSGDYLSVPDSADWAFGTNPFTIDCWVRFNNVGATRTIASQGAASNFWRIRWQTTNLISLGIGSGGSYVLHFNASWTPSINTWYHLAIVRIDSGNTSASWRIFIDGISKTLTKTSGNWNASIPDASTVMQLGGNTDTSEYLNGWLDEIRISNVARWTSDFTPPTEEYSIDALTEDIPDSLSLSDDWFEQLNPDPQDVADSLSLHDDWDLITTFEPLGLSDSLSLHDDWLAQITPDNQSVSDSLSLSDSWQALVNPEQQVMGDSFSISDSFSFWETIHKIIDTDLRWHVRILNGITVYLDWILGKVISTDLRWIAGSQKSINTDLRWLTNPYTILTPIVPGDIQIFVNSVDILLGNDIDVQTGNIVHTIGQKSQATFTLARRHDDLDRTHAGVASQITNQNPIQIWIDGHLEFDGTIMTISVASESESVSVVAQMEQPYDNRHSIELPLPSVNELIHPYHCLVNNVQIDNPKESVSTVIVGNNGRYWSGSSWVFYVADALIFGSDVATQSYITSYVDSTVTQVFRSKSPSVTYAEKNPQYYKGVKINLGTQIQQHVDKYRDIENIIDGKGVIAASLEDGTFIPKPNYSYFWAVLTKNIRTGISNGDYRYIGTSLGSIATDLWVLNGVSPIYQKIGKNIETDLGYYYIGDAPYKEISSKNGHLITVEKWQDRNDGLYNVMEPSYNYINFAKQIADLEYQKLLNIHGDALPIVSSSIEVTFDAYYYYTIKLLTRINVTNTTVPNTFNNTNGFPVSVKGININFKNMKVSLTTDNRLSQIEIDELDAQMPDADNFITDETAVRVYRKFDLKTWQYVS